MKILVISDYFYNLRESDSLDYIKWNEYQPLSLGGYDCILVDLTFESEERHPDTIRLLYEFNDKLIKEPDYLSDHELILIVVCGSKIEDLEFYADDEVSEYAKKKFSSYAFFMNEIPSKERIDYHTGKHVYPMAQLPLLLYFWTYNSGPTFIGYKYDSGDKNCIDINPLAKMKKKGKACVAFESRHGRGLTIVLPSYSKSDAENAFSILLRICRSYLKKGEGINELIEKYVDILLPESVRDAFIEAIICFVYDLYSASILMCRKSLEELSIHQGGGDKRYLRSKIDGLKDMNVIDQNMHGVAIEIIEFGNWGAHSGKFRGKKITEDDVMCVLDFLKIYNDYTYCLQKRLHDSGQRREELGRKETVL